VKISLIPELPSPSLRGGWLTIPRPWPLRLGPAEEDIGSIVSWVVWKEVTLQLDGIQWGMSLQDGLAYIPWTLVPFGMIPIGPGSRPPEDRPKTVIKITSLTHLLTCPSLTTPPSPDHSSATSRHAILSLTQDSHDTSQLSHDPNNIHEHLIILLCNGIWPFGKSVSVKGSTESAVLWEAFRHGRLIPHRQDTLEGFRITEYLVPPQRLIWWCTIFIILPQCCFLYCSLLSLFTCDVIVLLLCWFIHSHDPLLFRLIHQHSHTPCYSFSFGICFPLG